MCHCNPSIRTPNCGAINCIPKGDFIKDLSCEIIVKCKSGGGWSTCALVLNPDDENFLERIKDHIEIFKTVIGNKEKKLQEIINKGESNAKRQ